MQEKNTPGKILPVDGIKLNILTGLYPGFLFQLGFTPLKAEKPLQGMELQEKEVQKD